MTTTTPQRLCCIEWCYLPFHGKGMCRSHYMKVWRGEMPAPDYTPPTPPTLSERFWAKVARAGADDCWIWQASFYPKGYGQFDGGGAHVFAYEEANGPVAPGLVVDHLCHRVQCVNPAHLEAVPQSVNVRRGYGGQVAAARMKAHSRDRLACSHGHEMTPANTYVTPKEGWRQCKTCKADRKRKRASDVQQAVRS